MRQKKRGRRAPPERLDGLALEAAWRRGDYRSLCAAVRRQAGAAPPSPEDAGALARASRLRVEPTVLWMGAGATLLYLAAWAWALSGR